MPNNSVESKPLRLVVFSKDRPLQLDATIASLLLRCEDSERVQVSVLYTTSSPYLEGLYRQLGLQYPGVTFRKERHFRQDVLALVAGTQFIGFVVDDAIFVREFSAQTVISALEADNLAIGFSLRLGTNTTYCYPLDSVQDLPAFTTGQPGVLAYRWPGASHDFGYPFDLSSSVYRSTDIEPLLRRLKFNNPNILEAQMAAAAPTFAMERPVLLCFQRSAAFCIPANRVQSVLANRAAGNPDETPEALAAVYAQGGRIDLARYMDFPNNACHQEVPLWIASSTVQPGYSILIAAHDAGETIGATLESVLAQTYAGWEAYVVDDGSTDDTSEIVREYALRDERIHLVRQANAGTGAARNAAAALAQAEFLCLLDADDRYRPDYLASQKAFIDLHPGFDIYSCNADAVLPSGVVTPLAPDLYPQSVVSLRTEDMIDNNHIFVAAAVRAGSFRAAGGFRPQVSVEDYDLWLRLLVRGGTHIHNPRSLVLYSVADTGKTSRPARALQSMVEVYQDLIASESIGVPLRRSIRAQIRTTRQLIADIEWRELRSRLAASVYTDARRRYWALRKLPVGRARYLAGLLLVALNPRLFAWAIFHGRPRSWFVNDERPGIVAVIVYCDGRESPLIETLGSLVRQTLAEFAVLLVGQPPSEPELPRVDGGLSIGDGRRVSLHPFAGDVSAAARNEMVGAAPGRFVMELSAGDWLEPTTLEKAAWALETTPHAGLVVIDEPGQSRRRPRFEPLGLVKLADRGIESGKYLLRVAAWAELGGFDDTAPVLAEDQDLAIRMSKRGWETPIIPETLTHLQERDVAGEAATRGWLRSRHRRFYARAAAVQFLGGAKERVRPHVPFLARLSQWVSWKIEVEGFGGRRRAVRHPVDTLLRFVPQPFKGRLWKRLRLPIRPELWSYVPPLRDLRSAFRLGPMVPPARMPGQPRKTRLLVAHQYLTIGGAEAVVLNLLTRIDRNLFDVHLVTTDYVKGGDEKSPQLPRFAAQTDSNYQLPSFLGKDYFLRFLIDFINSRRVDVVLVSLSIFTYQSLPQLRRACPNTAFVDLLHSEAPYVPMDHIRLASRFGRFLNRRVVTTASLRSLQASKYGEDIDRVVVIPNGIDTATAFNPSNYTRGSFREELGIGPDVAIVLYFGRMASEKQPIHVVDVADRLRDRSDIAFVLLGDGPETAAAKQAISARRLANVHLVAPRSDIGTAIADADILMFPSKREGLPVSGIEAMAMGKPIVASNVPGWTDLVSNGTDGILVQDGDIAGYAAAITRLLEDPDLYARICRAGREKATKTYDLGDSVHAWERLLSGMRLD